MAAADPAAKPRSDLPVRVASAVVMVAVAGCAFWLRGWVLDAFIGAIVLGILYEWSQLVFAFAAGFVRRVVWMLAGVVYLGIAAYSALVLLAPIEVGGLFPLEVWPLPWVVAIVIAVDVGAYFFGRTFGGPKIAPAISPSKTWSGLAGASIAASLALVLINPPDSSVQAWGLQVWMGTWCAIIAQTGDFFESWMKRRAGVKDSGSLIPGHGGLFDRADGLIAVLFVIGVFGILAGGRGLGSTRYSVKVGPPAHGSALEQSPQPNASPAGEGLHRVSGVHLRMFVVSVAR